MNSKTKAILTSLAMVVVAGTVGAALLTVYVSMTGSGKIDQSVVFGNGDTEKTYNFTSPMYAGETFIANYNLMNRSSATAPIKFVTTYPSDNGGEGITTTYWSDVELRQKDSTTWQITGNANAKLTYQLNSSSFNYDLDVTGLNADTNYSLIYYADKQDRMTDWGGDNPGAVITTFTTDSDGNAEVGGKTNLKTNLPADGDWNATADANYCGNANGDNYELCRGAKVWIVPSSDYDTTSKKLTAWNPTKYLFETDLIVYNDTDGGEKLELGTGKLNFFAKHETVPDLAPGDYSIKTEVIPAN